MILSGAVIIPARFQSTRFAGKPLADIHGKPMIQHVYERCVKAVGAHLVHVATDSDAIKGAVENFGGNVIWTSEACLTGTDRVAEANKKLGADFIVNVQGDEPMINPNDIKTVFRAMQNDSSCVLNCFCDIEDRERGMASIPKVVVSQSCKLIYMSRSGIPFDKSLKSHALFKQVCIYGFSKEHLELFSSYPGKTENETHEDIELLRFLDMDVTVQMIKVSSGTHAVDTPQDLKRVVTMMADTHSQ